MFRLSMLACALLVVAVVRASATTYEAVTFDELITRTDVIFVGEVSDVRSYPLTTRTGTIIKTRVVFRVMDPLFGTTSLLEVFEFLGGEWNGSRMEVAEMPRFVVGDRQIVFARRERSINPIVGFTQGLLRIRRDSVGLDRVFTLDGVPVNQPENIGAMTPRASVAPTSAMRLSDFRDRISRALAEARR